MMRKVARAIGRVAIRKRYAWRGVGKETLPLQFSCGSARERARPDRHGMKFRLESRGTGQGRFLDVSLDWSAAAHLQENGYGYQQRHDTDYQFH